MVKRTKQIVANKTTKLNEKENALKPISTLFSKQNPKQLNDDLIISLSDAYENRRARQVFEWESLRRRSV
ncbi:MAG TPA: hypothetical protein PKE69_21980 [Pyrinomonadaceae bacterium]|nr:hypothetical protein [Pyrinomonadaceae bacterium]